MGGRVDRYSGLLGRGDRRQGVGWLWDMGSAGIFGNFKVILLLISFDHC